MNEDELARAIKRQNDMIRGGLWLAYGGRWLFAAGVLLFLLFGLTVQLMSTPEADKPCAERLAKAEYNAGYALVCNSDGDLIAAPKRRDR